MSLMYSYIRDANMNKSLDEYEYKYFQNLLRLNYSKQYPSVFQKLCPCSGGYDY